VHPNSLGVLTLDDDGSASAVDDLPHQNITALVGRSGCLADVFVSEVPEDVLHQILELESGELVE